MIRFIMFLFGKSYETCKSCETLTKQLDYETAKNKELTDTLISILKPKIVEPVQEIVVNAKPVALTFSRRRAELEQAEREKARTLANSPHVAKSDETIEKLEEELGVSDAS